MKKYMNHITLFFAILTNVIYIIWRILYTIPMNQGFVSLFFSLGLLLVEIIGFYELLIYFIGMNQYIEPKLPTIDSVLYPHVDVFIATYNEPIDIVEKTINGCTLMQYSDPSKIHIYICDDGKNDAMKQLAKRYNVGYITRDNNEGAKAGNLNHAMSITNSPFVVTFDADMIPRHNFLLKTIPYFLEQEQNELEGIDKQLPKIGFVQTPQSFYNTDLFQYNLNAQNHVPNEQDYFYRNIQLTRNASNTVVYCGSNTILRREAIEEIGGFYTNSITEDFATGMLMQNKGYKCIATKEVLASGLSPTDIKSLIKQRERWARGCIQTARRLNIWFLDGLSLYQKAVYSASILYWYASLKRFFYIICPILFSVFGVMVLDATLIEICIFYIPMYLATSLRVWTTSSNIRTTRLTNIYETILSQALLPKVLLETFGISNNTFSVTKKEKLDEDINYQIKQIIPFVLYAILSIIGIFNIVRFAVLYKNSAYMIVLLWLVINLYSIVMALIFMVGKKQIRSEDRFVAKVPIKIHQNQLRFSTNTIDVSSSGFSFLSVTPHYIDPTKTFKAMFTMVVGNQKYESELEAKIISVTSLTRGYKYACKITHSTNENYRQYQAIVFDREPTHPEIVRKLPNPIKEIKNNIVKHHKKMMPNERKTIRLPMRYRFTGSDGEIVSVSECNYTHLIIDNAKSEQIEFSITPEYKLQCRLIDQQKHLYKILNIAEVSLSNSYYIAMLDWMQRYKV